MSAFDHYHRPTSLAEALALLADPRTTPLAGGTQLIADPNNKHTVAVDLQSLNLDAIGVADGQLTVGAMCTLRALIDAEATPPLIRMAAIREGPNTFRNIGTVGGVVALADWESELYAALLVHEAVVTTQSTAGTRTIPLQEFQLPDASLITAVTIPTAGETAHARVARTPADAPIVAAVARRSAAGTVLMALCGVGERPLLVAPDALEALTPPADFRGSSAYRRSMASVLAGRVLGRLDGTATGEGS